MSHNRAWRRFKNFTKAKRKHDINMSWRGSTYNTPNGVQYFPFYKYLNQYSKNKIHCSCPMCREKTRNKGAAAMYNGSYNPPMYERRKLLSMADDLRNYERNEMKYIRFYGSTGYAGTDYEDYEVYYDDDISSDELDQESEERGYANAEDYEYMVTGWNSDWESEDDREQYYSDALDYSGWEEIDEEEYNAYVKE